jgi:hypothetical protein
MYPELRTARSLYYEWRCLPERDKQRLAPFARKVKELALDLRGYDDPREALTELSHANEALSMVMRYGVRRAA